MRKFRKKKICKCGGSVYGEILLTDSEQDACISLFLAVIYIHFRMQPYSAIYLPLGFTASPENWAANACFSYAYLLPLEHTEQSQGLIKVGLTWAQMSKSLNTRPLRF